MMRLTRLCALAAALTVFAPAAGMAAAAGGDQAYKLQPGPFPVRTIKLLVRVDENRHARLLGRLFETKPGGARLPGVGPTRRLQQAHLDDHA